ncbi:MAG: hypothetical protein ACXQT2_00145, partial [Methanotrichaceae archaeon]
MSFTSSFLTVKKLLVSYVGIVVEIVSTDTAYASDLVETKSMLEHDEGSGAEITIRILTDFAEGVELPSTLELLASDLGSAVDAVLKKDMRGIEESTTAEDLPARLNISAFDEASSQDLLPERELVLSEPASAEEVRLSPVPISVSDEAEPRDVLPIARKTREDAALTEEVVIWGSVVGDAGYGQEIVASISMETADHGLGEEVRVSPALLSVLDEGVPEERAFFSYWEGTVVDQATVVDTAPTRTAIQVEEGIGSDIAVSIGLSDEDAASYSELVYDRSLEIYDQSIHEEVRLSPIPLKVSDEAGYQEAQFSDRDTHVSDGVGALEESVLELYVPPLRENVEASLASVVSESSRFEEVRGQALDVALSMPMDASSSTRLVIAESGGLGLDRSATLRQSSSARLSLRHPLDGLTRSATESSGRAGIELRHGVGGDVGETLAASSRLSESLEHAVDASLGSATFVSERYSINSANAVYTDLVHGESETRVLCASTSFSIDGGVDRGIRYASSVKTALYLILSHDVAHAVAEATRLLLEVVNSLLYSLQTVSSRTAYASTSLASGVELAETHSETKATMLSKLLENGLGVGYTARKSITNALATSLRNTVELALGSSRGVATSLAKVIAGGLMVGLDTRSGKVLSTSVSVGDALQLSRIDLVAKTALIP